MLETKINSLQKQELEDKFKDFKVETNQLYLDFKAIFLDTTISIYSNSKKQLFKLLIKGPQEQEIANQLNLCFEEKVTKKECIPDSYTNYEDQIGSDEVGFGDFFGPIVVVGVYFKEKDKKLLEEYNIQDSKKLNDKKINEIVPKILNKFTYSLLVVNNEKLNSLFDNGYNLNRIKSILHNTVLLNLQKKIKRNDVSIYIDQFTEPERFYSYLSDQSEEIKNVVFKTKGESYFPSVALASCIARFAFINKMNELNKKYNMSFPYGASTVVDDFTQEFIKKYGKEELIKVCKKNFKNYKKLS